MERVTFTTPVGRVVMGNLYKANDKDAEGNPLVIKSGVNAGKPRVTYFFALAIPKGAEKHWQETEWGKIIYSTGAKAFPQAHRAPSFAWKIDDGDSDIPNKRGRAPNQNEGWPGHWVLKLSTSFQPQIYRMNGTNSFVRDDSPDVVKPGYFVQVQVAVSGNGSQTQPGVYLNPNIVCFRAYGADGS